MTPSAADGAALVWQPADPALVARVLAEARVEEQVPQAGWMGYVGHLAKELLGRLLGFLGNRLVGLFALKGLWAVVGWGLIGLGGLAVLALLARLVWRRLRAPAVAEPVASVEEPGPALPRAAEAAAWWSELQRRLAAGEVAAALEAGWWWLARSLLADRVDPAWTSRELVERAGRRDLAAEVRVLDRYLYGPRLPSAGEVGRWASGLARRLPG